MYVVIIFIIVFGIHAWEKCSVVKVDRHNLHDRLTVSVKKDNFTGGHLPWKISYMCTLLLSRGLPVATKTCWKIQYRQTFHFHALNFHYLEHRN